jgi:hypothetical protein
MTRAMCGDIPEQVRDDTLGQIIGFNLVADGEALHLRHEAPVTAHNTLEKPFVAKVVQASLLPVALAGRVNKGQVPRLAAGQEVHVGR